MVGDNPCTVDAAKEVSLRVASRPSNMLVYLRDGSAQVVQI